MISVIIPLFNKADYVRAAISSVLNQTYKDIEVIVVDDASTDESVKEVKNIEDDRIRVYVLDENHGANYARNYGISKAYGEYIAFQDGDDIWKPEKLQVSLDELYENSADIVFSAYVRKYPNGYEEKIPRYNLNDFSNKKKKILWENCVATPTMFGKKETFENFLFDESMPKFQDWELAIRMADKKNLFYIDSVLMDAVVEENGLTMNMDKAVLALQLIVEKNWDDFESDKRLLSKYLMLMGDFCSRDVDKAKDAYRYYQNALKIEINLKIFIKMIFAYVGIYPVLIFIKNVMRQKKKYEEFKK